MNEIDELLNNYEPGKLKYKPDVIKQINEIKETREKMILDYNKNQTQYKNLIIVFDNRLLFSLKAHPCAVNIILPTPVILPATAPIPPIFELFVCITSGFSFLKMDINLKNTLRSFMTLTSLPSSLTDIVSVLISCSFFASSPSPPNITFISNRFLFNPFAISNTYF